MSDLTLTVIEGDKVIRIFDETGNQVALMSDLNLANKIVATVNGIEYGVSLGWRDELPDEQGYWWWWDCDGPPVPVSIMFSGTDNTYFATGGQLGWNRAQNVKDMGGMWMRLSEPPTPETKEIYCHA